LIPLGEPAERADELARDWLAERIFETCEIPLFSVCRFRCYRSPIRLIAPFKFVVPRP